jgi:hypothetical protein
VLVALGQQFSLGSARQGGVALHGRDNAVFRLNA